MLGGTCWAAAHQHELDLACGSKPVGSGGNGVKNLESKPLICMTAIIILHEISVGTDVTFCAFDCQAK